MDSDLEQDYITIVQTMQEQIQLLKAKLNSQGYREERGKRWEDAVELRKLREEEKELRRELMEFGEIAGDEEIDENPVFAEVRRLSEELLSVKAEYDSMAGSLKSPPHSPTNLRLNHASRKLSFLTSENIELSDRLATLEAERKIASERYTGLIDRVKSEDRSRLKVKFLEKVNAEKELELRDLMEKSSEITLENGFSSENTQNQLEQINFETVKLTKHLKALQMKCAALESAETAALESTSIAQKLKSEVKQLDLTLQHKRKMLKIKEEELESFKSQFERLNSELRQVNDENNAFKMSLMSSPETKPGVSHTKSAGKLTAKPPKEPLFSSSYAQKYVRSRENRG